MRVLAIDHVQLAIPPGGEDAARVFYSGVLGLNEVPKPTSLADRGGVWFEAGTVRLHLGVDRHFQPAQRAHPAILVENLSHFIDACNRAQCAVESAAPIPGFDRAYVRDPFGNRIELMERLAS